MENKLILRRSLVIFFQILIVLVGIGAFAFMLWEPWAEGVNASATTIYQIYFDDPFLALVYVGSISFFVALYQIFKVLGCVSKNKLFSQETKRALRIIMKCAFAMIAFVVAGEIFIFLGDSDDRAGGAFMGVLVVFVSIVVIVANALFERILNKDLVDKLKC